MLKAILGDITQMSTDAIVNAANSSLLGGGGVDGAIHRQAGPQLLEECKQIGGCPTGEARITKAYGLPARWVIHTVGPVWKGGHSGEPHDLRSCYTNSLKIALQYHIKTIAFPSVSTGVYGYPPDLAAKVALQAVKDFISKNPNSFSEVCFVCFDQDTLDTYQAMLKP